MWSNDTLGWELGGYQPGVGGQLPRGKAAVAGMPQSLQVNESLQAASTGLGEDTAAHNQIRCHHQIHNDPRFCSLSNSCE